VVCKKKQHGKKCPHQQKVEKKKFLVSPTIKAFCFPQKSFEVKNENQRNIQENKLMPQKNIRTKRNPKLQQLQTVAEKKKLRG